MTQNPNPIDWPVLLQLTNNKPELARELLDMFAVELPILRSAINTAYAENNWKEMKNQVHKLHGSCCYTGVPALKSLSRQLEELLRIHNEEMTETVLNELNTEITRVLDSIKDKKIPE